MLERINDLWLHDVSWAFRSASLLQKVASRNTAMSLRLTSPVSDLLGISDYSPQAVISQTHVHTVQRSKQWQALHVHM